MDPNMLIVPLSALIPLVIGAIYYMPKVMGNMWMKSAGLSESNLEGGNMIMIFLLSYVFFTLIGFAMMGSIIHQMGIFQAFMGTPGFDQEGHEIQKLMMSSLSATEGNFRTFPHGLLHGGIMGLLFAVPVISVIKLFERKPWSYVIVHGIFWTISLALMGGVISAFC